MRAVFLAIFVMGLLFAASGADAADDHAAIIMYHRFGEDNYPSTNIKMEQFETHLSILQKGGYSVWPLPKIVDATKRGAAIPDRTVAITIDDAAASVYQNAWPILRARKIPFTLFVTTDDVDRNNAGYMTWDQLRELHDSGLVTIGNHTKSHPHLPQLTAQQIAQEIIGAENRMQDELGVRPDLFAYPYGEYSDMVIEAVKQFKFKAAFGQHSGMHEKQTGNIFTWPRFSLNESYGAGERFKTLIAALPLPVYDLQPANALLDNPRPTIRLKIGGEAIDLDALRCYASDQGKIETKINDQTVSLTLLSDWPPGRARVNCTLGDGAGRYYWWGTQYIVP